MKLTKKMLSVIGFMWAIWIVGITSVHNLTHVLSNKWIQTYSACQEKPHREDLPGYIVNLGCSYEADERAPLYPVAVQMQHYNWRFSSMIKFLITLI
jgi:hypothetical protein